jgi:hypothetical protein
MTKRELLYCLEGTPDDMHLRLDIETENGTVRDVLTGVLIDTDKKVYLSSGPYFPPEKEPEKRKGLSQRVTPYPSSPYVGPNGEFYPMGGEPR